MRVLVASYLECALLNLSTRTYAVESEDYRDRPVDLNLLFED
jgi:hypothetical protein